MKLTVIDSLDFRCGDAQYVFGRFVFVGQDGKHVALSPAQLTELQALDIYGQPMDAVIVGGAVGIVSGSAWLGLLAALVTDTDYCLLKLSFDNGQYATIKAPAKLLKKLSTS